MDPNLAAKCSDMCSEIRRSSETLKSSTIRLRIRCSFLDLQTAFPWSTRFLKAASRSALNQRSLASQQRCLSVSRSLPEHRSNWCYKSLREKGMRVSRRRAALPLSWNRSLMQFRKYRKDCTRMEGAQEHRLGNAALA